MKGQPLNFKEIGFRKAIGSSEKQLSVIWVEETTMDTASIQVFEIIDGKKVPLDPEVVKPNQDLRGYVFTCDPASIDREYEVNFNLSDGTEVQHRVFYESGAGGTGGLKFPGTEGDVLIPVKP